MGMLNPRAGVREHYCCSLLTCKVPRSVRTRWIITRETTYTQTPAPTTKHDISREVPLGWLSWLRSSARHIEVLAFFGFLGLGSTKFIFLEGAVGLGVKTWSAQDAGWRQDG